MSNMRWRPSRRPHGLTLIEALAGTAILATVLATSLVAAGRLMAQSRRAGQISTACRLAEDLLVDWRAKGQDSPEDKAGQVAGPDGATFWWQVAVVENPDAQALGAKVLELRLGDQPPPARPLVSVQVLAAMQEKKNGSVADSSTTLAGDDAH